MKNRPKTQTSKNIYNLNLSEALKGIGRKEEAIRYLEMIKINSKQIAEIVEKEKRELCELVKSENTKSMDN